MYRRSSWATHWFTMVSRRPCARSTSAFTHRQTARKHNGQKPYRTRQLGADKSFTASLMWSRLVCSLMRSPLAMSAHVSKLRQSDRPGHYGRTQLIGSCTTGPAWNKGDDQITLTVRCSPRRYDVDVRCHLRHRDQTHVSSDLDFPVPLLEAFAPQLATVMTRSLSRKQ